MAYSGQVITLLEMVKVVLDSLNTIFVPIVHNGVGQLASYDDMLMAERLITFT